MKYSVKDLEFLGRQVAEGHYVARTTFLLSLLVALMVGGVAGYFFGDNAGSSEIKQPVSAQNQAGGQEAISKHLFDSILQQEQIVQQKPDDAPSWVKLGDLYFDTRNPDKAIAAYEKALAINPDMADVWVDCGVMYRAVSQFDKALEYFAKALKIQPKHLTAMFNSGVVLHNDLKNDPEALRVWGEVVAINPEFKTPDGRLLADLLKAHEAEK
jgi:Cytochrome c biogenesis factor